MTRRILVTADDYGLDAAVNRGIERLAAARAVDAVSVMAHADADWSTLPALARSGVELGAHLVLVAERPLTGGRALAPILDGGRLPASWGALFARIARRPSALPALADEAAAQLARLEGAGVPLRFVNSHQHVHLFPPLWIALRPLLDRAGWRVRAVARGVTAAAPRQLALELSARAAWACAPLRRASPIRPLGVGAAGRLGADDARREARRVRAASGDAELVFHPADEQAGLDARYPSWRYRWAAEFEALHSGAVRRALDAAGAEVSP